AVSDVSFKIEEGEFVVILGHNGSGKSTLSRMLNALIFPHEGNIFVDGIDTSDENKIYDVRTNVGMVFQNPDSQIVCSTVEEELAFGPSNLGISRDEILKRIDFALKLTDLEEYRFTSPSRLSGGQKQKVAVASVLTMKPKYIILDEPTSMLDPYGRLKILETLRSLNKEEGISIILVTQLMREAFEADRVLVMNKGSLVFDGNPQKLFSNRDKLKKYSLDVPVIGIISEKLKKMGIKLSEISMTSENLASKIVRLYKKKK
ncbi:energy-coupling factor transporter ATPase, partial [bacterium]|nr:energy-coupling factor transporter ATPase [bacterium]